MAETVERLPQESTRTWVQTLGTHLKSQACVPGTLAMCGVESDGSLEAPRWLTWSTWQMRFQAILYQGSADTDVKGETGAAANQQ